jgi:multidrug transporter EmrE-like cation transporter
MFNIRTLLYGLGFGLLDATALPIVKNVSRGWNLWWMAIPMILYGLSPFIFLKALSKETLTIMNLVWDLSSDVVITLIGLFVFAEHVPPVKLLGVFFSFIALFLMTYEGNGWNEFLSFALFRPKSKN